MSRVLEYRAAPSRHIVVSASELDGGPRLESLRSQHADDAPFKYARNGAREYIQGMISLHAEASLAYDDRVQNIRLPLASLSHSFYYCSAGPLSWKQALSMRTTDIYTTHVAQASQNRHFRISLNIMNAFHSAGSYSSIFATP